ncbi:MAG: adenosylcobinamide amidohydrolase [Desulfosarcina sp.]|nr:adenosylcobinamide amidohydrolase [Desulfosarcina sp.]MBC2744434.1 adenosylcobinamide amidohydrolase [Desulfosarcina sp.]MBC2767342.1 ABC transporter substrate-binding protein [Desulfosarcina sp.]
MRLLARFVMGLLALFLLSPLTAPAGLPIEFQDAAGRTLTIVQPPQKVVSIVPSITEILFRIGAGDAVGGVTYHDTYPPDAATKPVVGGFFAPSLDLIDSLEPDVIFLDDLHQSVVEAYVGKDRPRLIQLPLASLDDLYLSIRLLGQLFDRDDAADDLIRAIQADLAHTAGKIAPIPASGRKRVIRLMGRDQVMTPGDDSFQNEMIRLAGGIPPKLGKPGSIVPVTLEDWQAFNPQVIYGCGGDREAAMTLLNRPGWKDVDAVKNGRILYFPCDLTCRLSSRTGYFVSCLASRIYGDEFAALPLVRENGRIASRPIALDLDYVDAAETVESTVNDYIHKTLLIHLASPMSVSSTLEGFRRNIRHVGNSYSPPQVWGLYHHIGLETSRNQLIQSIDMSFSDTSLLFTGADMDNLSVQRQQFKEMTVYALVTAGVCSNAVRMGEDVGAFYEPGTINMVILSNMRLTPRAMNRAIISATEAKTAALWDMDIRSSQTPLVNPATGTGTDNIIVVEGQGPRIDNAGGHSKMGELIAKAVYAGVREAVFKQNGIVRERNIFQRLKDRRISLFGLVGDCNCGIEKNTLNRELEHLLLDPEYAGFIEAALAISDHYERGLIADIGGFEAWCDQMAAAIAGKPIHEKQAFAFDKPLPPVLKMAFDALLNGVTGRLTPAEGVQ